MRLLVSVVDAGEARVAAAAGADVIDVKDPSRGALGEAAPHVVRAVREATPSHLPVSAALGDGPFTPTVAATLACAAAASGAAFVKLGLRETSLAAAAVSLRAARARLPDGIRLVAAGFADFARAGAPHPLDLPGLAVAAGAQGCLLDTAVKDGRGLLHWLGEAELAAFVEACRAHGLLSALAGSLTAEDLARLAPIGPDLVGVRGAACVGDRVGGRVDAARVRALVRARGVALPAEVTG
jgi:(5-formylfuran-3-yl)methyl phosphate synthase